MTELERLTAAMLAQWRADGGADGGSIAVGDLLDRVLPYRVARRMLGIDASEDYEALLLRLLSEDENLVRVDPVDAADMAKATINSRLPDLGVLQLLRAAMVTPTDRTLARLGDVLPMPSSRDDSKWAGAPVAEVEPVVAEIEPPAAVEPAEDPDVIPLRPMFTAAAPTAPAEPPEPPPEFLTTVKFTPPAPVHCWSCGDTLPADRVVKFCPFCGADQRQPTCTACGATVERGWRHCPDCGVKL